MTNHPLEHTAEDTFLMCAPDYFEVSYVINPWMAGNIARSNERVVMQQWQSLVEAIGQVAKIENVVRPRPPLGYSQQ